MGYFEDGKSFIKYANYRANNSKKLLEVMVDESDTPSRDETPKPDNFTQHLRITDCDDFAIDGIITLYYLPCQSHVAKPAISDNLGLMVWEDMKDIGKLQGKI